MDGVQGTSDQNMNDRSAEWIPAKAGIRSLNSKMTKASSNLYPDKQTERECLTKPEKGTTIDGALRLARNAMKALNPSI